MVETEVESVAGVVPSFVADDIPETIAEQIDSKTRTNCEAQAFGKQAAGVIEPEDSAFDVDIWMVVRDEDVLYCPEADNGFNESEHIGAGWESGEFPEIATDLYAS